MNRGSASTLPAGEPDWFLGLRRIEAGLIAGEKLFCALSLAVMLFSTALTVLARNAAFQMPNYGEIGLAAMVPFTLIGGALCTALGSHITIDLLQAAPSRLIRRGCEILVATATAVFAWFYFNSGVTLIEEFRRSGDKLLDLGTPLWVLTLAFPAGVVLMTVHAAMRVLGLFVGSPETHLREGME